MRKRQETRQLLFWELRCKHRRFIQSRNSSLYRAFRSFLGQADFATRDCCNPWSLYLSDFSASGLTHMATTFPSSGFEDRRGLIQAYAQLFRFPVGILAAFAGCATLYTLNPETPLWQYLLTGTVLACMYTAACAINDYWDLEKDRINHPERPLPSGRLSLQQAYWAAVILFSCAIVAAVPLGVYALLLVAVTTVLLWHYSHLLAYSGILGNVVVAITVAALIFLGSLVADRPFAMIYPTGFLFCYSLAKEIIWDISDLAAFSISPIGQRFEDNFKPSLGRNFGTALDGFEQLEPDNRGEQYL